MKTALITGALGQDGSYLTEYLLGLGYYVFLGTRRLPENPRARVIPNTSWVYLDVRDELSIRTAIKKSWPDEIYNLAGQVYVPMSWEQPAETFDVNTSGLGRILKVVEHLKKETKVYQASSSEMFGNHEGRCNEETEMNPESPYGISKFAAHRLVRLYRNRGLFVVAGILFNHESPRRGSEMVTKKIARHVAQWAAGSEKNLFLGNMESRRDWGFAGDYVRAMHAMLQYATPKDYVIGMGESYSVADFLEVARVEMGIDDSFVKGHTSFDQRFARQQEIMDMSADTSLAKEILDWKPTVDFKGLVRMMVRAEYESLKKVEEVVK